MKFPYCDTTCKHKQLLATELFSALIHKPMEKSYWHFVKGTRVSLMYVLTIKYIIPAELSCVFY